MRMMQVVGALGLAIAFSAFSRSLTGRAKDERRSCSSMQAPIIALDRTGFTFCWRATSRRVGTSRFASTLAAWETATPHQE